MIQTAFKTVIGVTATLILLSACSGSDSEPSAGASSLLKYIPADSPYVFATTKPFPEDLMDKIEPAIDELLQSYQHILRLALDKGFEGKEDTADRDKIEAVVDELLGLMSVDGARSAGIERGAAFAFYGNGLVPVIRFELSNEALFDAAITRIEEKAEYELAVASVDGKEYKYFAAGEARIVIATLDGQMIMTAFPAAFDEAQVALALGVTAPAENLQTNDRLGAIEKEYDYVGYFSGYVDNRRVAEIMTGGATGLDKELFDVLDYEAPALSDVCRTEMMELVNIAPRIVFGYNELTADKLDSSLIVELRDDIAAGLATVSAAVPGLGTDPGGFMSFGFGIDLLKAREFVESRVTAMEEDPFECESLASVQLGTASARAALSQPIPPVAYSMRGFFANIVNVEGVDFSNNEPPESVDGSVLFAIDDAETLLSMAANFVPSLAQLNLKADGKAVKLEMDELNDVNEFGGDVYAAMSDVGLALGIGDDAEENAEKALVATSGTSKPLIGMSMDAASYYELLGDSMMQQDGNADADAEPMPMEMREALRDIMIASGELYERMAFYVRFTERGIEIDGNITIAD